MDCRQFQEYAAEYVLNDPCLTTADREGMQCHMSTCSNCCQLFDKTQWVIALIRENRERVRQVISRRKEGQLAKVAAGLAEEGEAESLAVAEPVIESPEIVQSAWQRLKASFEKMDRGKRRAVRARRIALARWSAAIAVSLLVVCGLGFMANTLAATAWVGQEMLQDSLARRGLSADDVVLNLIASNWSSPAPVNDAK